MIASQDQKTIASPMCLRASSCADSGIGPPICYAYFNNDGEGNAVRNARELRQLTGG